MLGWCQEIWRRIRLEFTIEASCRCWVPCSHHCHAGHTQRQLGVHGGGLLMCLPCVLPAVGLHWGATQALLQGLELTAITMCPCRPARPLQAGCQAQLPTWSAVFSEDVLSCLQLPLLRDRWKLILFGACFQYVHGMATQLAHRVHQPMRYPLHDVGFAVLPVSPPRRCRFGCHMKDLPLRHHGCCIWFRPCALSLAGVLTSHMLSFPGSAPAHRC